jgi:uncharacterized protein YjbI with pentapeptide repeats
LTIATLGLAFNRSEKLRDQAVTQERIKVDRDIAAEQRSEQLLQMYFDRMSDLLLNHNLRESAAGSEARAVAHSRTLTAIRSLDANRKTFLLDFLFKSGLIEIESVVVPLNGVDLSGLDLHRSDLNHAYLGEVNLSKTNLRRANLFAANLFNSDMRGTNLIRAALFKAMLVGAKLDKAELDEADMTEADMVGTSLREAGLHGAKFRGAKLINADFAGAKLADADFSSTAFAITDLSGASFKGADLTGTRFVGAYLYGADFTGTTMTNADFTDAVTLEVKGLWAEPTNQQGWKPPVSLGQRLQNNWFARRNILRLRDGGKRPQR